MDGRLRLLLQPSVLCPPLLCCCQLPAQLLRNTPLLLQLRAGLLLCCQQRLQVCCGCRCIKLWRHCLGLLLLLLLWVLLTGCCVCCIGCVCLSRCSCSCLLCCLECCCCCLLQLHLPRVGCRQCCLQLTQQHLCLACCCRRLLQRSLL
jgi:hypothetical protein